MKLRTLLSGIVYLSALCSIYGQWPAIYGDSVNLESNRVWENYDKGYVITGRKYLGWSYYGWINKTDVNGEILWEKSYGNPSDMTPFSSSRITTDGGLIISGSSNILSSSCTDPLIIKTNACGEKEWCKIYNAQWCNSWAQDIEILPDGGYMALIKRWQSGEENRIWLFKLDSLGDIIWSQTYATDTAFFSETSHSLIKTQDSCFVITGEAYYPDSTYPGHWIKKIILIKVKQNGEIIFEVPWGPNNGIYSDGRASAIDAANYIYTAGRRARTTAPFGDSPCLFKTSATGNPVFYNDLKESSTLGISTTINWFQDSTLVQCAGWVSQSGSDTTALIKTDSLANFIKEKPLLINYGTGSFWGSDITINNKLILAGSVYSGSTFSTYLYKVNSDLEYDSIYTTPFTYDSLCPYPIVSDTIPLDDCEVIVSIDDPIEHPEKTRLHVYPNPAKEKVTVEMPEYLIRKSEGNGISATTYYHQWPEVRMVVFNLFGRIVFSKEIQHSEKTVPINISTWPKGMYLVSIVFMNDIIGSGKFIVN